MALAVDRHARVLVLHSGLPGRVLRAIADAGDAHPGVAVLVVGPLQPIREVLVAFASQVRGYLATGSAPERVGDAVDTLCAGEVVLPDTVSQSLLARLHGKRGIAVERADGSIVDITQREWTVFVLLRQAHTSAQIAERLVLAPVTVRTHIAALVHKLAVADRHALTVPPQQGVEKVQRSGVFLSAGDERTVGREEGVTRGKRTSPR